MTEVVSPPSRLRRWLRRLAVIIPPLLLVAAWVWLGVKWVPPYVYQINPDGVGYLSVAQSWAAGRLGEAVNGYWSPLLSWLVVPWLWAGVDPMWAMRMVQHGAAVLAGAACWWLMAGLGVPALTRLPLAIAATIVGLSWSMTLITPDVLMPAFFLLYLAWSVSPRNRGGVLGGLIAGLLGGVAYLAKAYALPLVVGHLALLTLVRVAANRGARKRALVHGVAAGLALSVVVAAWAIPLSMKYGHFTVGSTGPYNHRLNAPSQPRQPMHAEGLLPLPHAHAYSAWDDPTYLAQYLPEWSRWSPEGREHAMSLLDKNTDRLWTFIDRWPWVIWPVLAVGLVLIGSRRDIPPHRPMTAVMAATLCFPLGYLILHVLERFLVLGPLLILVLAGVAIATLSEQAFPRGAIRRLALATAVAYMMAVPAWEKLDRAQGAGASVAAVATQLHNIVPAGARIASDTQWGRTLYISFYNNWRYLGDAGPRRDAMKDQFAEHDVEYLFVWRRELPAFARDLPQLNHPVNGLTIVKLTPAGQSEPESESDPTPVDDQ